MAQADTIIPPGVQGLDRYAYVNNSPMNFVDPTGHKPDCDGDGWCGDYSSDYSGGDAILDSWRQRNPVLFNYLGGP
ncbi:MAG: hypothetical protein JNK32_06005 [Anaerolineales bacterium]|nr:hypothetical protein [Anaerolineales bacterium]